MHLCGTENNPLQRANIRLSFALLLMKSRSTGACLCVNGARITALACSSHRASNIIPHYLWKFSPPKPPFQKRVRRTAISRPADMQRDLHRDAISSNIFAFQSEAKMNEHLKHTVTHIHTHTYRGVDDDWRAGKFRRKFRFKPTRNANRTSVS